MKLHLRSKVQGQLSKVSKAKNFGDLYFHENTLQAAQKNSTVNTIQLKYDVSCKKLHFFTCEVQGQLSKEKQKISVTTMKLHFITFEVNYPKYLKQKISVTSMKLHLRSKVQGQLSKVSKAKNFGDLYFHENTLQAAQKNSTVNTIQLKYDVSCKKLHFFTCVVQGQLSKEKQKILVTSMKLHFIKFEVNYPKYLKQKISVTSMKLHLKSKVQGQLSKVSKAKNFGDLYFHENTLQAAQKNSTANTIQLKYDVSCKKLHFFTCVVQGQLSKEKQKILVTSMKLHFIKFEVN